LGTIRASGCPAYSKMISTNARQDHWNRYLNRLEHAK